MKIKKSRLRKIIKEVLLNEQNYKSYKIKKGDTLSAISKKSGVPIPTLAKVNKIKNVDFIRAGDTLKIPAKGAGDEFLGGMSIPDGPMSVDPNDRSSEPKKKRGGRARMFNRDEFNRVKKSLGPRWDRMVKKYGESEAENRVINYMSDLGGDDIKFTVDGGVKKPETLVQKLMRLRKTKVK
jgi:LysM repeat protein